MNPSKISDLLEKINRAAKKPDFPVLPKIELDLVLQQVRELYAELDNVNAGNVSGKKEYTGNTIEPVTETLHAEPLVKRSNLYSNKTLLLNDIQPKEEPAVEEVKKVSVKEPVKVEKEVAPQATVKSTTINERVNLSGSLNEKLKASTGTEVHKKHASKPLKDQLDLNKRFVLLNELFKGNSEAFTSAINHIDSLDDYETAETFIKSQLVSNYYWDESSQTARLFMKLVKQKFGMNP